MGEREAFQWSAVLRTRQVVSALGAAVRNENVRRVELAWGAWIATEWAYFVALGVFAYQHGGASAVGVAGLVRLLPAAAVAPFAASLGDRFRRERFLLALMLLGSAALAGSAAAAYADSELLVFALAAVVGFSSTLVRPALQALLPSLARTPEELIAANGATSTIESLGTLIGPFGAGLLVSFANVGLVFGVGAAAVLAAAGFLARVRVEGRVDLGGATEDGNARRMIEDGFRAIARTPNARLVIGLITAQAFVRGCLNVLIVIAAFRLLHGSASDVGYLTAAIGVGGLVGAFGAMALDGRRLAVPFGLALVFWGVPIALIAPRPDFAAAMVLLAIVGAANSVEDVAVFTLLQRIVRACEDRELGADGPDRLGLTHLPDAGAQRDHRVFARELRNPPPDGVFGGRNLGRHPQRKAPAAVERQDELRLVEFPNRGDPGRPRDSRDLPRPEARGRDRLEDPRRPGLREGGGRGARERAHEDRGPSQDSHRARILTCRR